jgi:hypothetical protein
MKYTVVWLHEAEDELALLWLAASDRNAITAAQAKIDKELAREPEVVGAHVAEGLYQVHIGPLKASFEIEESDRVVRVVAVRKA